VDPVGSETLAGSGEIISDPGSSVRNEFEINYSDKLIKFDNFSTKCSVQNFSSLKKNLQSSNLTHLQGGDSMLIHNTVKRTFFKFFNCPHFNYTKTPKIKNPG
jgi:hypothetical protein